MVKPGLKIERVEEVDVTGVGESHPQTIQPADDISASTVKARRSRTLIVLAFAAVYLIWGSTYLAIKYAIGTLPPFLMASTRFLTAGAMIFAWVSFRSERSALTARSSLAQWRRAFIIGALLLLCGNGGVTWSEKYLPSGLAALLIATEPFWMVVLTWFIGGVRPNAKVLVGLVTGLIGVALLVGGTIGVGSTNTLMSFVGVGVVIASSLAWAGGSVYSIYRPVKASAPLASGMQMLAGGTLLLLMGLVTGELRQLNLSQASWISLAALAYLIVFGSLVAFTAYSWLLRTVSPALSATYAYVNPVVAVFLGWIIASEPLSARTLIAAGIIVASVALITTYGKERVVPADESPKRSGTKAPAEDFDPCPNHPCA